MPTCTATRHGTERAYRDHKCRCPGTLDLMCARWAERNRHRRTQRRHNYDHVAVLRAILGDRTLRLTVRERGEAVRQLTQRAWTARRIAEHLGCSVRTVENWRARHRARSAVAA